MAARVQTVGGGGGIVGSPLGQALSTLVQWRDAFAAAAAALQPVFDAEAGGAPPVAIAELIPPTAKPKALTAGKKTKAAPPAPATRKGGTDPKVIARIQELAAKGLSVNAIAAKAGVSYPTAKKYAEGHAPAVQEEEEAGDDDEDDDDEPAPVRTPPLTSALPAGVVPGTKKGPWI